MTMEIRAVLFDFDGVLVNSEPLHFAALRDALAGEGVSISEDEYWRHLLAYDDREATRIALERHGRACAPERIESLAASKAERFARLLPAIPFFPGARELVLDLARHFPLGIASGALHSEIEAILSSAGLHDAFRAIVGADDVERTKPHPEPYLLAMERLKPHRPELTPAGCLVIEDSLAGVTAGLAAGMKVAAVAHSYPPEQLRSAHRIFPSLVGLDSATLREAFAAV